MKFKIGLLFVCMSVILSSMAELPSLKVSGRKVLANGKEIRLRGINWGWWEAGGTIYREKEMKQMKDWNINIIRLAFTYDQISDENGKFDLEKIKKVDRVISWAEKYGIYVILDMHVYPGTVTHFYKEVKYQDQFIELWEALAARYKDNPVVAAYELMNEPDTTPNDFALLRRITTRAINAIRPIAPEKIIIVSGDEISSFDTSLDDWVKQEDPNIIYTIHHYLGSFPFEWLANIGEESGLAGTKTWTYVKQVFDFSKGNISKASSFRLCLRSTENQGKAWFDDLQVKNLRTGEVYKFTFDNDEQGFVKERPPMDCMKHDTKVGHNKKGSLFVGGTPEYNGWISPAIPMESSDKIEVSGWVKLENATGKTSLVGSFAGVRLVSIEQLREGLKKSAAFRDKYNVPIYVGEFAIESKVAGREYQQQTIADRIQVFEELGYHWTYWNYRETTDPTTMALHPHKQNGEEYPVNAELLKSLKGGWDLNKNN
ncbi:MAG: glycoside hydrolase family 5 protein [Lentisphaeria bacterium]|nr:glycoside hydrolase family 5 protein [Lentisphaeria bacterium]